MTPPPLEIAGLTIHRDVVTHPLLGDAHVISLGDQPLTAMSAIDWDRPTRIPTVAEPRALPPGRGSALLNELARRAQAAGIERLRYAGPYPTHALFKSLLRSFDTDADEDAFTSDLLGRAMRLARDEIAVDFRPAPFTRRTTTHGWADVRDDMLERAYLDGVLYDADGTIGSLARLRHHATAPPAAPATDLRSAVGSTARPAAAGHAIAELGFGTDLPWHEIAELDPEGNVTAGPLPIPTMDGPQQQGILGKEFPPELREQFADTAAEFVAAPLAADARKAVLERTIIWQDLGWRSAARTETGFALHAALWTFVYPRDRARFVLSVSYHLAMIVQTTLVDEVAASLR